VDLDRRKAVIVPLHGGVPTDVPGTAPAEVVLAWLDDRTVLVGPAIAKPTMRIDRVDLVTGGRDLWRELRPPDPGSVASILRPLPFPDGEGYAYFVGQRWATLYLVQGLR
jgi:hypothetical protein